jgi:hypothetical protein
MMPSSAAHAPDPLFTACPPLHRPTEARLHRSRELPTAPLQLMARRTRLHSPPPSGAAIAEPPYSLSLVKPKPSHRCPPFIPFFPRKPTPPEATHRLLSTPPWNPLSDPRHHSWPPLTENATATAACPLHSERHPPRGPPSNQLAPHLPLLSSELWVPVTTTARDRWRRNATVKAASTPSPLTSRIGSTLPVLSQLPPPFRPPMGHCRLCHRQSG